MEPQSKPITEGVQPETTKELLLGNEYAIRDLPSLSLVLYDGYEGLTSPYFPATRGGPANYRISSDSVNFKVVGPNQSVTLLELPT